MEKKNDSTILLLMAAGLGIYWLLKKQSVPPATTSVVSTSMPVTAPAMPVDQTIVSTQPVYTTPVDQTVVSTQPVYTAPEVINQPAAIEYTPISDMISTVTVSGGLVNNANQNIVPIDNINLSPKSALSDQYL